MSIEEETKQKTSNKFQSKKNKIERVKLKHIYILIKYSKTRYVIE
jgi:hypothetical protein